VAGAMKHWRTIGSVATAHGPRARRSVGTSRQPKNLNPLFVAAASIAAQASVSFSGGRNAIPRPKASGKSMPASSARPRMNFSGMEVRRPAPSPLAPSASTPPRCESLTSASSARSTTSREPQLPSWTTNPTPQASWSGCA